MKKIEIKDIRRDPATQMRVKGQNQAIVDEFAEKMESGEEFPEIVVFFDGKVNWLADGWKRVAGHEKAFASSKPMPPIAASVRKGGLREATLFAAGANADHGERRTNADKRNAVYTLLKDDEWTGWSDGVIAKRAKVSQPFVSARRRELEDLVPAKKGDAQNVLSTRPAKRRGADNVMRAAPKRKGKEAVKVTDRRRVHDEPAASVAGSADGPAPGMILDGKKEKKIASLITDKPLYISFTFIPKVGDVSVSVHRGDASTASRLSIPPSDLPRMPEAIQKLIVEQLNGKGK